MYELLLRLKTEVCCIESLYELGARLFHLEGLCGYYTVDFGLLVVAVDVQDNAGKIDGLSGIHCDVESEKKRTELMGRQLQHDFTRRRIRRTNFVRGFVEKLNNGFEMKMTAGVNEECIGKREQMEFPTEWID